MFFLRKNSNPTALPDSASLVERTDHMESEMIAAALDRFHWNKTKAAVTSASSAPPFSTRSRNTD